MLMTLVLAIDILVVTALCGIVLLRGLEAGLPFATFVLILVPEQSRIPLPLFDLTTQRVAVFTLFILYLFFHRNSTRTMRVGEMPLRWLILAQLAWALLSTSDSIVPMISLKKLLSQTVEYYLLYFMYTRTVTNARTVHKIFSAMVGAMIVCCTFGAVQAYTGWDVTAWFPQVTGRFSGMIAERTARGLRVTSTFPHPILFGVAIAAVLPIALYLLAKATTPARRAWLWCGIFLMFLSIYKTSSRGPWLALVLGSVVIFFFGPRRIRASLLFLALLSMAVLIVRPGVWETVANYYFQTLSPSSPLGKSYEYRYALRRVSQEAIDAHFSRALWGYGMESFYYLGLEGTLEGRSYQFLSCDSTWIEFMVETGYIGLLIMVLMLFKADWVAWSGFRKLPGPERYASLAIFAGISACYFSMLSVDMYSWGQDGYILWSLISLAVMSQRVDAQRGSREEAGVRAPIAHNPWLAEPAPSSCVSKLKWMEPPKCLSPDLVDRLDREALGRSRLLRR
jgi:hypothetical protein